jgi:hypothetical protein
MREGRQANCFLFLFSYSLSLLIQVVCRRSFIISLFSLERKKVRTQELFSIVFPALSSQLHQKGRPKLGQTYKLMMTLWHDDCITARGKTCRTERASDHSRRIVAPYSLFFHRLRFFPPHPDPVKGSSPGTSSTQLRSDTELYIAVVSLGLRWSHRFTNYLV